jgi:Ser/Thr protein kinase RdoA (MazF antagonist)
MAIPIPILDSAAALFGIKDTQIEPLHGGHFNHLYGFTQDSGSFVLRITPPSTEINSGEIKAVLDWMRYLAEHKASVPNPILSIDNNLVEIIEYEDQAYLAAVLEAADGTLSEEVKLEQWDDDLYQILGSTIGRIHNLASQYKPSNPANTRPAWNEIPNNFNPQSDPNSELMTINNRREALLNKIDRLPKDNENYGLIHGDLHFGNFFLDIPNKKITIFDFDDSVYSWYMMDIATLLFDILVIYPGTDRGELAANFLSNLLKGYSTEKPISSYWINQIPDFLKLLEIGIYILVYQDYNPEDRQSWVGKFMHGRKSRIEEGIPYIELDFEGVIRSI